MSRRRVSVELELNTGHYMANGRGATVTTKALKHEINDLGDTADNTARDVKGLGHEADETAGDLVILTGAAETAGRATDQLDRKMARQQPGWARMRDEIKKVEQELHNLAVAFATTGDQALVAQIRTKQNRLGELERLAKLAAQGAGGLASTGSSGMSFAAAKPILIGGLVALAVAAAPAIGAVIAGAVTGVVGAGGVVGGILAARKDPRVAAAAHSLAESFGREFTSAGSGFAGPLEDALHILRSDLSQLHLADTFRIAAPYVTDLAHGIGDLAIHFMPRFNHALDMAAPVISELRRDLPDVGDALGQMLEDMAGGKGTVEGMRSLMMLLSGTFRAVGTSVGWLSDRYDQFTRMELNAANAVRPLWHWVPWVGGQLDDLRHHLMDIQDAGTGTIAVFGHMSGRAETMNEKWQKFNQAADQQAAALKHDTEAADAAAEALKALTDRQSDYIDQRLGLTNARLAWKQDFLDLKQAVKDNGTSLDENTQKGLDNAKMIAGFAQDAQRMREELLRNPATAATANQAFESMIRKIEDFATSLGFSRDQVDALIRSLLNIPSDVTVGVDIVTGGESHAADRGHAAPKKPTKKNAPAAKPSHQFAGARAGGGAVLAGYSYDVGERGRERLTMYAGGGGYVTANPGGGGGTPVVNVSVNVDPISGRVRQVLITDAQGRNIPQAKIATAYP